MSKVYTSSLLFKGVVDTISDLPETAGLGDVWYVKTTDSTYVYTGTDWTCMSIGISGTYDTQSSIESHAYRDREPGAQICTQCGGVLESDKYGRLSCPYCGTIYK